MNATSQPSRIAANFDKSTYTRELPTGGFEFGQIEYCEGDRRRDRMQAHGRRDTFAEAEQERRALKSRLNGGMGD